MSESCEESCVIHESRIRKARKQHRCSACRATIRPGDYYTAVFTLFDGNADTIKRCGACDKTWEHLYELCQAHNKANGDSLYPREDLGCGLEYEDEWGDLPDEIAALAFMSADERGALLAPKPAVAP